MVTVILERQERKNSVQVGFTEQRLTAYGGAVLWSGFLTKLGFHRRLREALSGIGYKPKAHNALSLTDIAIGFIGGVILGADRLARIASLGRDIALHEVLGIKRMASQATFSRFFGRFSRSSMEPLQQLHAWALKRLPSRKRGYTLDLDSVSLLHEDGHQEGVRAGYTRKGFKPCLHPLVGALAEPKMIAGYWLRCGNTIDSTDAARFCSELLDRLPAHIGVSLVRADSGFHKAEFFATLASRGIRYIVARALSPNIKHLCRLADEYWQPTGVDGIDIQEASSDTIGQRIIVIRQLIEERPNAGGKLLLDVPGYRFQSLTTSLSDTYTPLQVWRKYHGRADCENRIREIGSQFAIRGLCCKKFWATEASHHLAIAAYNLFVLFLRELETDRKIELRTLRASLFCRAAVWSRPQNKPTLKLAVCKDDRPIWEQIVERLLCALPPPLIGCNSAQVVRA